MLHFSIAAKIGAGLFGIFIALLAVGEATSDRTLILISIMGNGTLLVVGLVSATVSIHNSRKLTAVSMLPQKVDEFRQEVDGRMKDLARARQETADAKQEVAGLRGAQQERSEERERVDAAAATSIAQKAPFEMKIMNKKTEPVPTIPGEEEQIKEIKKKKTKEKL